MYVVKIVIHEYALLDKKEYIHNLTINAFRIRIRSAVSQKKSTRFQRLPLQSDRWSMSNHSMHPFLVYHIFNDFEIEIIIHKIVIWYGNL